MSILAIVNKVLTELYIDFSVNISWTNGLNDIKVWTEYDFDYYEDYGGFLVVNEEITHIRLYEDVRDFLVKRYYKIETK